MGASVPVDLGFAALLHVGTFTNPEAFQILSWRFYYARLIGNPQPLSCPWRLEGGAESSNSFILPGSFWGPDPILKLSRGPPTVVSLEQKMLLSPRIF